MFATATICNCQLKATLSTLHYIPQKHSVTIGYVSNAHYEMPASLSDAVLSAYSVAHTTQFKCPLRW
jgi:hypothetical protein